MAAARFALSTHVSSSRPAAVVVSGVQRRRAVSRCIGGSCGDSTNDVVRGVKKRGGGGGAVRLQGTSSSWFPGATTSGPIVLARAAPIDADDMLDVAPPADGVDPQDVVQRKRVRARLCVHAPSHHERKMALSDSPSPKEKMK